MSLVLPMILIFIVDIYILRDRDIAGGRREGWQAEKEREESERQRETRGDKRRGKEGVSDRERE